MRNKLFVVLLLIAMSFINCNDANASTSQILSALKGIQDSLTTLLHTLMHRKSEEDSTFGTTKRPVQMPTFDDDTPKTPPIITGTKPFQCAAGYGGAFSRDFRKTGGGDFTSNMLEGKWSKELGWEPTYITPFQNLTLSPASRVLLHGQQVFDSIQATIGFDNRIRLFRPDQHLQRLRKTAARFSLPDFDDQELLICIKRLVLSDATYIPPAYTNGSLEVRIVLMSADTNMKFSSTKEASLYAYMFRHTSRSVADQQKSRVAYADSKYARSWIGSLAQYKTAANYAGLYYVTDIAEALGCNDVLWLYSKDELVTDMSEANVFVFIINERNKKELITPPLNGLIVPGITRQSILEMTRYWNEFTVTERTISIHEIRSLQRQRRLLEMIATNTFGNAIPVIRVHYEATRTDIHVPTLEQRDPLWERLNRALHSIEYGLADHPWGLVI